MVDKHDSFFYLSVVHSVNTPCVLSLRCIHKKESYCYEGCCCNGELHGYRY